MDSKTDASLETKTKIVMIIALLILSFSFGWVIADRTPYCRISSEDADEIWESIGTRDLRYIHENMTLAQVKELYDRHQPLSKYVMIGFLSGVCK